MLNYSKVTFNEAKHTYVTPDGKILSGITGMIDRQIFGGRFANMDKDFLRPYAEYGSKVHKEIDAYYTAGVQPETPEALAFIEVKRNPLATEYTVSDNEHFATNIDMVDEEGIYDFKTSAHLDTESLSWQLSIAAYLFELQNGFSPSKLFGVHLRGTQYRIVEIQRKPMEAILSLFKAEISNEQYIVPMEAETAEIRQLIDLEQAIIRIKQEADYYDQRKKELLAGIEAEMDKQGLKKFETDSLIVTKVLPTISKSMDTARLKKEIDEAILKPYEKETERAGYIKLTLK